MSTKVKLEHLRNYIKEIIKQELKLQEASATSAIDGGEGPPKTPYAFQGKRKKDKDKEKTIATNSTGYKKVNEVKFHVRTDFGSVLVDASGKGEALMKVAKALKGGRSQVKSVNRVGVSQAKQVDKKIESVKEIKVKMEHLQKLVNTYGTKKVKEALTEYWWDDLSDEEKDDYVDKHGEAPKRRGSTKDKAKSPEKKKQEPEKKSIMTGKGRKKKPNPKKWEDIKAGDVYKLKSGELMHVINYGDNHIQTIIHPNPEHTSVSGGKKRKRTMVFAKPGKSQYKPGFNPKTATLKQQIRNTINSMPFNSIDKSTGRKDESITEGKYHDYRNDESLSPKQKIGYSMREVRDKLNELDKLVKMNVRFKNEVGVDSTSYWKNTHNAMKKISERLVKLANKVGQLY